MQRSNYLDNVIKFYVFACECCYKDKNTLNPMVHSVGNDNIHQLTRKDNVSLYVSIKTTNGEMKHQVYEIFSISNESNKYKLTLGDPTTGTLGTCFSIFIDLFCLYFKFLLYFY